MNSLVERVIRIRVTRLFPINDVLTLLYFDCKGA